MCRLVLVRLVLIVLDMYQPVGASTMADEVTAERRWGGTRMRGRRLMLPCGRVSRSATLRGLFYNHAMSTPVLVTKL